MASITASCARGSVSSTFGALACLGTRAAGFRPASVQLQAGAHCFAEHHSQRRRQPSKITCLAVSVGNPTSTGVNRTFVTEAAEEILQDDTPETDDSEDQLELSGMVDEIENVDDEMEEVLAAMTSSIGPTNKLKVLANSMCVGIDPDLSGAIAVLKSRDNCTVAEVIDVPCITVAVNKRMRRRHDYQSMAAIVQQLQAPKGSIAYVEQAMPFPKDGKQGWYLTGYGYGVWLGILATAGFTVIPVQARYWKTAMGLCGKEFTKDDSRALASSMFPVLSAQLRRKKDHGRAEALLIAAFGKGMTVTNAASQNSRVESANQPSSLAAISSSQEPPF